MVDNPIHFGSSGWRGVITEDFTFAHVRPAAAGIAHFLLSHAARPRFIVGYDTRFLSEKFATVARRGASIKEQFAALFKKVVPCTMACINLHLEPAVQKRRPEKLKRDWDKFDSQKVVETSRTDGVKVVREDGSWVLVRPSGIEPVDGVYCEAPGEKEFDRLLTSARAFVFEP